MANQIDDSALPSAHLLKRDGSTRSLVDDEEIKKHSQVLTASPSKIWLVNSAFVIFSGIVPVLASIFWLALSNTDGGFKAFSGEKIGG